MCIFLDAIPDKGPPVRYNALSRNIESTLQKDSVPNRIVGGHKFFERMEIKDILAYLQLAENPDFTVIQLRDCSPLLANVSQPAFARVVNVPRRAIGDKVRFAIKVRLPAEMRTVCCGFDGRRKGLEGLADAAVGEDHRWRQAARKLEARSEEEFGELCWRRAEAEKGS